MELVATGCGNIVSALFGGLPATGAIARTAANIDNGGRAPLAGIAHSIFLLIMMLCLMNYISLIPMTALAAILFNVSYRMSDWRSFVSLFKAPASDILVLLVTFALTVIIDLVAAIEFGLVLAAILFMKRMADVYNVTNTDAWWAAVHGVARSQTRLSDFTFTHWRRKWQPTPVFLPGESQGWGSLVGCRLWGHIESDMTEAT